LATSNVKGVACEQMSIGRESDDCLSWLNSHRIKARYINTNVNGFKSSQVIEGYSPFYPFSSGTCMFVQTTSHARSILDSSN